MKQPPVEAVRDRLHLAIHVARQAGVATLSIFGDANLNVEHKGDGTPVTIADREAERLIRAAIETEFPADAIVGEELGQTAGTSEFRWIVDPIDGTKSFVSGVPLYTTLIGLLRGQQAEAGVIFAPVLDELVYGSRREGAWYVRHGQPACPARVSSVTSLSDGLFLTSEVISFQRDRPHSAYPIYRQLEQNARLTRTWGDGYGYLLVATGRAEVMVDPVMNVWDAAAVAPILEAAGGTFTDWKGRATVQGGEGVGTNGHVLEEVLRILQCDDGPPDEAPARPASPE